MKLTLQNKNLVDLSKIFSPTIFRELSENGKSKKLTRILIDLNLKESLDENQNLGSFFNDIYFFLSKNYKNEYIYKNTIIKKILLGRHSLNTAYLINECRVGNSKADSVILNGTSTVYEIKSEYDSFTRLDNQISDYKKAFEYIYIVVPSISVEKLKNNLHDINIGILRLNKDNSLTKIKDAKSNKKYYDKEIIFDILKQKEYKSIVEKYFNDIPDIPNTKVYCIYKKYFEQLDSEIIHKEFVKVLKSRGNNRVLKDFILSVPESLKALAFQTKLTKKAKINLLDVLKKDIKNII